MNDAINFHAIVLKRSDSGESDRKLTLLTQESGVMTAIARGARKPGSRLSGATEPLSVSLISLASGRHNRFLRQVQPISSFPRLRADFDRLNYSLSLCELASSALPHGKPAPEEFELMVKCLRFMEVHENPFIHYIWAQLQLLELCGFLPSFTRCIVTGQPIAENPAWFTARGGGYVAIAHADEFVDRVPVCAEALLGLSACGRLALPPEHLRFAQEASRILLITWREHAHTALPATESVALQTYQ